MKDLDQEPIGEVQPSISDVIVHAIHNQMANFHQGLPARVVKFYGEAKVDVQILLMRAFLDPEGNYRSFVFPIIKEVPVIYPGGGGFVIKFPLKVDDIVYLTFAERSMDDWLLAPTSSPVLPSDRRKFDINDAVCIPGLRQFTDNLKITDNSIVIGLEDGTSIIEISANRINLGAKLAHQQPAVLGANYRELLENLCNEVIPVAATTATQMSALATSLAASLVLAPVAAIPTAIAVFANSINRGLTALKENIADTLSNKVLLE